MIIMTLINILFGLIKFIFRLINLPAMPFVVIQAVNNVLEFLALPIGVVRNYVGDQFLFSVIGIIITFITLEYVFYICVWLYNKIRGSA